MGALPQPAVKAEQELSYRNSAGKCSCTAWSYGGRGQWNPPLAAVPTRGPSRIANSWTAGWNNRVWKTFYDGMPRQV